MSWFISTHHTNNNINFFNFFSAVIYSSWCLSSSDFLFSPLPLTVDGNVSVTVRCCHISDRKMTKHTSWKIFLVYGLLSFNHSHAVFFFFNKFLVLQTFCSFIWNYEALKGLKLSFLGLANQVEFVHSIVTSQVFTLGFVLLERRIVTCVLTRWLLLR
jgi:hypothetical protein